MGRAFEFRLEPLLEVRNRIEQARERDLFAARRRLDECETRIRQLGTARGVRLHAADVRLRDAYLRRANELEAAVAAARDALVEASRERRVIETLKERLRRAFDAEAARREELELDDANARRRERARRKRVAG